MWADVSRTPPLNHNLAHYTSDNGTYCYFDPSPSPDFSCDDQCAANFYQAAHDYAASKLQFNYYWLISRGSYWAGALADGWTTLVKCGKAVGNTSLVSSMSSTTSSGATTATAASRTSTAHASATTSSGSLSSSSMVPSASSSTPSAPSSSGNALRVESSFGVALLALLCVRDLI